MNDEWNRGYFSTGPQRSHEARQGQFARQQELRQERDAAARAARERDQRMQDQMIRDAIWTASQPAGTDTSRIFSARSSGRRGGMAGLAVVALVLLFVWFGTGKESLTMRLQAVPAQSRPPPAVANPGAAPAPAPEGPLTVLTASVADRSTAAPPMPPMDRFALRRLELVHGDDLDLVVSWQLPDGTRRAAAMDAFIVTRDTARRRTALLERWSVFPGESTIPLALPPGIPPGKYDLETVWTLGGEAREMRTGFTLLERPVVAVAGSTPATPPARPAPGRGPEEETPATAPPPPREAPPAPASEQAIAPDRPPATTAGSSPVRPRTPANDQLYLGG
jgi:hypothetical protein